MRILGALVGLLLIASPLAPAASPVPAAAASASPGATSPAGRAPTWLPPTGQVFNNPTGTVAERYAILRRVHNAIKHTAAGETIRIATYSIDLASTAKLLAEAKKRGVNVQVVINDNTVGTVERRLQARLGKNRNGSSFLVVCHAACRNANKAGNMHLKIYSFTRSGAADGVVISSSGNLSGGSVRAQWNDAFTIYGNPALFDTWVKLFDQLRRDKAVSPRRVTYRTEGYQFGFQRQAVAATSRVQVARASGDPVINRIRAIGCKAPAGYGSNGHSVIRITMVAWYGKRGVNIARAVAARKKAGCKVTVIGAVMSTSVVNVLKKAKIPTRAADWDWGRKRAISDEDSFVYGARCYSHLKAMTLSGVYKGKATNVVFTGSENWSPPGLSSDEVSLEIHDRAVARAYNTKWKRMWSSKNATHPTGIQPTRRPCK